MVKGATSVLLGVKGLNAPWVYMTFSGITLILCYCSQFVLPLMRAKFEVGHLRVYLMPPNPSFLRGWVRQTLNLKLKQCCCMIRSGMRRKLKRVLLCVLWNEQLLFVIIYMNAFCHHLHECLLSSFTLMPFVIIYINAFCHHLHECLLSSFTLMPFVIIYMNAFCHHLHECLLSSLTWLFSYYNC